MEHFGTWFTSVVQIYPDLWTVLGAPHPLNLTLILLVIGQYGLLKLFCIAYNVLKLLSSVKQTFWYQDQGNRSIVSQDILT